MGKIGFTAGKGNPCVFNHKSRDVTVSVHVGDFLCLGDLSGLGWLRQQLNKEFEFTSTVLGCGAGESMEVKYLNRIIRQTTYGITFEHDPRHVANILKEVGLSDGKGVVTPGLKEERHDDDDELLGQAEGHKMRRIIAILNYISQDRADIGYATKECARMMSKPTKRTVRAIHRVARYLKKHPRRPQIFKWQRDPQSLSAYTDADWAGCERTRRSTSGGVLMRGTHVIKHWSKTQVGVALSSAESELVALIKASTEALGMKHLRAEMGSKVSVKVLTDSSAARGAVMRTGCGRMKHVATQNLWVQEKAARGEIQYLKVARAFNFADLLTHNWDSTNGERMLRAMGMQERS